MQQAIQAQLDRIVGLPLWAMGNAGSLLWLQFGERRTVSNMRGGTKDVGTLALHVDCPWYWKRGSQIVASWRSEPEVVGRLLSASLVCRAAIAQVRGSFELQLDGDTTFVATVEDDTDPEAEEYWRIFEPSADTPHFVVGAHHAGT
jgi:hypothetical protein